MEGDLQFFLLIVSLVIVAFLTCWIFWDKVSESSNTSSIATKELIDISKQVKIKPVSDDVIRSFRENAYGVLSNLQIDPVQAYNIRFGLIGNLFQHRAVIIDVLDAHELAFRLEIFKDTIPDLIYKCYYSCKEEFSNLTAYFKHLEGKHCQSEFIQTCCEKEFTKTTDFWDHIMGHHKDWSVKAVAGIMPELTQIGNDKYSYSEYMKYKTPIFFGEYPKAISFKEIIESAELLLMNFGSYFFFGWNCQDFAAWFLTFHGIPLSLVDPTGSDFILGSGTSKRSVRDTKEWLFYKDLTKDDKSKYMKMYDGEQLYTCEECEDLSPMTLRCLELHNRIVHERM